MKPAFKASPGSWEAKTKIIIKSGVGVGHTHPTSFFESGLPSAANWPGPAQLVLNWLMGVDTPGCCHLRLIASLLAEPFVYYLTERFNRLSLTARFILESREGLRENGIMHIFFYLSDIYLQRRLMGGLRRHKITGAF